MKLDSLNITRTVKVAGGETVIVAQYHDLKDGEGVDAISQVEDLASFAIREAFEKISDAPKEEQTQHTDPSPGTDFEKDPAPRPEDAPKNPPAAAETEPTPAVESAPPEKTHTCSKCGGPATEDDRKMSQDFLPQDMFGQILCSKCMTEFKADQLKKPEPPAEEKPAPEPAAEDTGFKCSSCGKSISKAEEQLSNIFMGRALCKNCLEEAQK